MSDFRNGTGAGRTPARRAASPSAKAPSGVNRSAAGAGRSPSAKPYSRPQAQSGTSAVRRSAAASAPKTARPGTAAAAKSAPRAAADSFYSRSPYKKSRKPDWPVLLMLGGCVLVLITIITLIIFGIVRCASGCNSDEGANPGNLQIVLSATKAPDDTAVQPQASPVVSDDPVVQPTDEPSGEDVPAINYVPSMSDNQNQEYTGTLRRATIRSVGDFVIHDVIFKQANRLAKSTGSKDPYNFAPMLNYVRDAMENADFTVANVDGSMGGKQYYKYGYSGYPQFNTPPHLLYALRDAGVDMLTIANNHMLDGWFDGLKATLDNVESVGIKHVGANRSQEERDTPRIYEINGIKVGFLNYTESLNSMERASGLAKEALEYGVNWTRNSNVNKDAKAMREAGAEVIVCYMHWGEEYEQTPDANQKKLAKTLVTAGVDVIIGGHPHVVQYAEWLSGTNQFGEAQRTLCLYSLGNFLSDQRLRYRDGGIIFDFTIQEQADGTFEIINPTYLPTWVWRTGDNESNYIYNVVAIDQFSTDIPPEMTSEDYQTMLQSYNDSINAMSKGVGTRISR